MRNPLGWFGAVDPSVETLRVSPVPRWKESLVQVMKSLVRWMR